MDTFFHFHWFPHFFPDQKGQINLPSLPRFPVNCKQRHELFTNIAKQIPEFLILSCHNLLQNPQKNAIIYS